MSPPGIARRILIVAALVLTLAALARALPTLAAAVRAGALVADAVWRLPVRPLAWLTPAPQAERLTWPGGGDGLLTLPGDARRHPALVVTLGAQPAGPDDPRVQRLLDSLARVGFVTLLVQSEPLIDGVVTPAEVPLVVGAFVAMGAHPRVRPERIGFVGLSVGASIEMIAATDPAIAERVAFVLAIGPYGDAGAVAAMVAARAIRGPDGIVPWQPDPIATSVVTATLLAALPEADRAAVAAGIPAAGDDGETLRRLLATRDLDEAGRLVARLSPGVRARLDAVSPRAHLRGLRAPLYLLHDRHDVFIPWTESETIAASHTPAVYAQLDLFEHVDPRPRSAVVMLRDGWTLLRLFTRIIREANSAADVAG